MLLPRCAEIRAADIQVLISAIQDSGGWLDAIADAVAPIAALGAVAAAAAAFWAIRAQNRNSITALSVSLVMQLQERYDAPTMTEHRRAAAEALLDGELSTDLTIVLGFFDTIGHLSRNDAIDESFVSFAFFDPIDMYCRAAEDRIRAIREQFPTRFEALSYLRERLISIEEERVMRAGLPYVVPTQQQVRLFLLQEADRSDPPAMR